MLTTLRKLWDNITGKIERELTNTIRDLTLKLKQQESLTTAFQRECSLRQEHLARLQRDLVARSLEVNDLNKRLDRLAAKLDPLVIDLLDNLEQTRRAIPMNPGARLIEEAIRHMTKRALVSGLRAVAREYLYQIMSHARIDRERNAEKQMHVITFTIPRLTLNTHITDEIMEDAR